MKNLLTILLLIFINSALSGQDRIYFINQEKADVQIDSIVGKQIFYTEVENGNAIRKTINTRKVRVVYYADGRSRSFLELYKDPTLYTNQRKRAFKLHLFSPLMGHTQLSYEQSLRPGVGLEFSLGIIGLGNNFRIGNLPISGGFDRIEVREDQKGVHVGIGYKFYSKPVIRSMGRRYKHLLHGWYLMPKMIGGFYEYNVINNSNTFPFDTTVEREDAVFGSLMLYTGKQMVFAGSILLDWQLGLGYGFSNSERDNEHHYVISIASKRMAIGGGIRMGFVF